ncbi:hypothetical protein DWQ65_05355 [Treponema phagedenis]|uniref:Amidohydrolase n=1 Tax=Treponema phagedenis TaxID=162 RepID=A0A0B7GT53_TREPH|nr:hypothetical protein [Treponema phagedenis]QSH94588.1 hypothetical protein C5O78_05960 [Treponema phagedenis]QSH99497.1 hypothetical protein DWQ65_05355 [Treponema phagedenis]CEM61648.1 hypothetical protein TPHV1_20185 [Treponema phagedenis]
MNINDRAKKYEDYVVKQRRYFHMHPEASTKEFETSKYVQNELRKLNIPFEVFATTGIIGRITGTKPENESFCGRIWMRSKYMKKTRWNINLKMRD